MPNQAPSVPTIEELKRLLADVLYMYYRGCDERDEADAARLHRVCNFKLPELSIVPDTVLEEMRRLLNKSPGAERFAEAVNIEWLKRYPQDNFLINFERSVRDSGEHTFAIGGKFR